MGEALLTAAVAWLSLPALFLALLLTWKRVSLYAVAPIAVLLVGGALALNTEPEYVARDFGTGLLLPLGSLRALLEFSAPGMGRVHQKMATDLLRVLPEYSGGHLQALGLVWRGSLAAAVTLAVGLTAWFRLNRWLPQERAAKPVAVEQHPEPPAIPKSVVARAAKGAVPVITRGLLHKREVSPALPIGYGPKGEAVCLTGPQMTYHGLVVGLTGAGKTTFMAAQIRAARALGWSVVCLDLKGSPSLQRLFYELPGGRVWTPSGPLSLDLLRGKPDEVAAKIVTVAGTVTGQQFNQIMQGRLTELVGEIDARGAARTFTGLQALLRADIEAAGKTPQQALVDLEARLRTVTTSSAEPYLRPGPDALHLERSVRAGEAVLLSVPVPRLKLVGEKLGAWALADANRVASRLTATDWGKRTGKRCLLLVDEFAGLKEQGAHAAQPLAMVREGGVSIWLYTQTLSGLKRLGDVAYSEIVGNVNVTVVMRQSEPGDQDELSALMGTYETQEFGQTLDGETGKGKGDFRPKRVTKPYVAPGQIAALPVGHAYVRIAGGKPVAVVIPKVADGDAEVPEPESDDDDGTPDVPAPDRPDGRTAAPPTPGVAPAATPGATPGALQRLKDDNDAVF